MVNEVEAAGGVMLARKGSGAAAGGFDGAGASRKEGFMFGFVSSVLAPSCDPFPPSGPKICAKEPADCGSSARKGEDEA